MYVGNILQFCFDFPIYKDKHDTETKQLCLTYNQFTNFYIVTDLILKYEI